LAAWQGYSGITFFGDGKTNVNMSMPGQLTGYLNMDIVEKSGAVLNSAGETGNAEVLKENSVTINQCDLAGGGGGGGGGDGGDGGGGDGGGGDGGGGDGRRSPMAIPGGQRRSSRRSGICAQMEVPAPGQPWRVSPRVSPHVFAVYGRPR
jgi:hypothetical protein